MPVTDMPSVSALVRQRQLDLCKFKATLIHTGTSLLTPSLAVPWAPVLPLWPLVFFPAKWG